MLLMVWMAFAHAPHDVATGFAAPYDLSDSSRWWVSGGRPRRPLFNYSRDAGYSWYSSSTPGGVAATDLCMMTNGDVLSLASPRYYYSTDDGGTFTRQNGPGGTDEIACGTVAWFASSSGIYTTSDPAVAPTLSLSGDFDRIWAFVDEVAAIDTSGVPWVWDAASGTWSSRDKPGGHSASAMSANGDYAGTRTGAVYWFDASTSRWTPCGELPSAGSEAPAVDALAVDGYTGATVLAGASYGGPYVSTDACATWTPVLSGDQPYFDRPGGPSAADPTWTEFFLYDGMWVTAGWGGVWTSVDGGANWTEGRWFVAGPEPSFVASSAGSPGPVSAADGENLADLYDPDDPEAGEAEDLAGAGCAANAPAALLLLPISGLVRRRRRSAR